MAISGDGRVVLRWEKSFGAALARDGREDVRGLAQRTDRPHLSADRRRAAEPVQPGIYARPSGGRVGVSEDRSQDQARRPEGAVAGGVLRGASRSGGWGGESLVALRVR